MTVLKIVPVIAILIMTCEFFLEPFLALINFFAMNKELFNIVLEFRVLNIIFTNLYKFKLKQ